MAREFLVPPTFLKRLHDYQSYARERELKAADKSKSDYWVRESKLVNLHIESDRVRIEGSQGFYVPPVSHNFRTRLGTRVRRAYKRAVLAADKVIGGSEEHAPASSLTHDLAYDYVMRGDPAIDYGGNPFRFNHTTLKPVFKTAAELRRGWFLRERYFANDNIITTAYHHAMFSHFLPSTAKSYIEIGAGNGNLVSFLRHYNHLRTTVVELPETVLHAASYLQSIFPESSVVLPNELTFPINPAMLDASDIVFLNPDQCDALPDRYFDIAVNVHSMQEMTRPQIAYYFSLVQRIVRDGGIWANTNRVEKVPGDFDRPTRASEFPYNPNNEILVDEIDRYLRLTQRDGVWMHIERVRD